MCTLSTAVGPAGEGHKPHLWLSFLNRITAGDREMQGFLQRTLGYCLTGSIKEHAMFFWWGDGGNGKGTLLDTIVYIMGDNDYSRVADMEMLLAGNGSRHPTDIARLAGARLVSAQESEKGRHWAESKLKALTGGDPITARFMHQDFFTYNPEFKLIVASNEKPGLSSVKEAIRRRMYMNPFLVTIPKEERDLDLPEKLKPEWPGILRWVIEGCLDWQRIGLAAPASVIEATEEYFASEDVRAAWFEECCEVRPRANTRSMYLFASWQAWAQRAGEQVGSQKMLSEWLKGRGYVTHKHNGQMVFTDLMLKAAGDESGNNVVPMSGWAGSRGPLPPLPEGSGS